MVTQTVHHFPGPGDGEGNRGGPQRGARNGVADGRLASWLRDAEAVESLGGRYPDSAFMAQSAGVGIWQTEKTAWDDCPWWVPPFLDLSDVVYRGFAPTKLQAVLETGLDVPAQSAFFASSYPDKAWKYPRPERDLVTMLALDRSHTERSFATKPACADDTWTADTTIYPNEYSDGTTQIHTRFEVGHGTRCFLDEEMYGFWVPGEARTALLGVVIGGPQSRIVEMLNELQLSDLYSHEIGR